MELENRSTLVQADFQSLAAAWRICKSPVHAMLRMQRICFVLAGLALMGVSGAGLRAVLLSEQPSVPLLLLDAALLIAGLAVIFFPTGRNLADKAWQSYPEKGMEQDYRFTQEQIVWQNSVKTRETPYTAIQDFLENDSQFLLFFPDGTAHILHKDGFTAGDAETFRSCITERTGLAVRPLPPTKNRKG